MIKIQNHMDFKAATFKEETNLLPLQEQSIITTLKQLTEDNKSIVRIQEDFQSQLLEQKTKLNIVKSNFIRLLSLTQYQYKTKNDNQKECPSSECINNIIKINKLRLENINLTSELQLDFLNHLITSEGKDNEYVTDTNKLKLSDTFDCRPFKGPKTPPTPNSKASKSLNPKSSSENATHDNELFQHANHILYYLRKFKNQFADYSQKLKYKNTSEHSDRVNSKLSGSNNDTKNNNKLYEILIDKQLQSIKAMGFNDSLLPKSFQCKSPFKSIDKSDNDLINDNEGIEANIPSKEQLQDDNNDLSHSTKHVENFNGNLSNSNSFSDFSIHSDVGVTSTPYKLKTVASTENIPNKIEEGEIIDSGDESKNNNQTTKIKSKIKPVEPSSYKSYRSSSRELEKSHYNYHRSNSNSSRIKRPAKDRSENRGPRYRESDYGLYRKRSDRYYREESREKARERSEISRYRHDYESSDNYRSLDYKSSKYFDNRRIVSKYPIRNDNRDVRYNPYKRSYRSDRNSPYY